MLRISLLHGYGLIVATAALLLSFALPAASPPILADNAGAASMQVVTPNDLFFTPIGHTGGPVQSVAALGRYVLVGAGHQVFVFDALILRRPRLVFESQALPEQVEGITIAGQYAYVVAGSAGLFIYDLAEPKAPVLVASLPLPGTARDATISGIYAYVAAGPAGLRIIDVSDVTQPVEVGFFDNPAYDILNVAVEGQYAYVTGGQSGLHVLDVSDPVAPSEATSLDLQVRPKGLRSSQTMLISLPATPAYGSSTSPIHSSQSRSAHRPKVGLRMPMMSSWWAIMPMLPTVASGRASI